MTFRDWFARHEPAQSGGGRGVLLWVDTFTEHFSPEVGIAAVRVLEAAGFSVQIPGGPRCCGLTWISTGQLGSRPPVARTERARHWKVLWRRGSRWSAWSPRAPRCSVTRPPS